ncbi:TPA: hypothetical protein N0F65_007606 [Lagenidium giganteum]|uniref:Uncharacterized protein n=1 Tax=Lagenidium giganteum TaxID=4803 RepID=A0AAV2ZNH1_9STRA|nr:TPA: hypothetical protein N0F65_007606 [Lagenidium giganteum]
MGCPPVTSQDWFGIVAVALFTGVLQELVWVGVAFGWCYPVPFREVIGVIPFFLALVFAHWAIARSIVTRYWRQLKLYLPVIVNQFSMLFSFLALAFVFANVSLWIQVAMVFTFPVVKVLLKHWAWERVKRLNDLTTDMTICLVEIASSFYQTVCMQYVNAPFVIGLLIAVDAIQAILEVRLHVNHPFIVDGRSSIMTAINIVESSLFPGQSERSFGQRTSLAALVLPRLNVNNVDLRSGLSTDRSESSLVLTKLASTTRAVDQLGSANVATSVALSETSVQPSNHNKFVNLLDLSQLSEHEQRASSSQDRSEISSVRTSSQSAVMALAQDDVSLHRFRSRQPSAIMIDGIMVQRREQARILEQTLQLLFSCEVLVFVEYGADSLRSFVYSSLEVASFVVMAVLIHRRYGFSVLHQLAFVLENYWMSLHGKLIGCAITATYLARCGDRNGVSLHGFCARQPSAIMIDGIMVQQREQARIFEQTLQLLFSCVVLAFVEHIEIAVPILYATLMTTVWHLPNAKYHLVLAEISETELNSMLRSLFVYSSLEVASFVVLIRRRYGF